MTPLVSVRHVSKRLGDHQAVDDVSFEVMPGAAAAVLGPSGSGKTTLLRLIAGLETPDSGEVWLDGARVSSTKRLQIAPHERQIGFVFQDLALWPHMTVRQHLEFVIGSSPRRLRTDRVTTVLEMLRLARIDALAGRYPHELSGGEQQRVALARALVGRPRLLLLDEPLSSLDPELRVHMRDELGRLQGAVGVAMLYVTHHLDDVPASVNRIIRMRAGRIVPDDSLKSASESRQN